MPLHRLTLSVAAALALLCATAHAEDRVPAPTRATHPMDALTADEISLTYMACSAGGCKVPVIGKMIPIKIPGADALKD